METLIETTTKIDIHKLKSDFKELAEKQKFYRNQKKTVHIIGERQMPAGDAWYQQYKNRQKLRIMYAAYGIIRGKSFSQIENHYAEENHPLKEHQYLIDALIKKYKINI